MSDRPAPAAEAGVGSAQPRPVPNPDLRQALNRYLAAFDLEIPTPKE